MVKDFIKTEHDSFFQTYKRLPIVIDRAEGCYIYDANGRKYLDFLAGIAVNLLGHSHPGVIRSITKQAERFMHVSNYFYQPVQIEFAEKLLKMSGYDRIFLTNSGAEAIEGTIKLARRWGWDKGKNEIISFTGGFHGRTYGALSIMDKPFYKDKMGPFLDGMKICEFNNIEKLENSVNEKTCAVVLEFIQGEGGISSVSQEFADKMFELKNNYNFLIVADEIQTGGGRTGKFFSFEHFGVKPDIVTIAKGIGGGLPLGAILGKESLNEVWEKGMHGTTFGGNALACAAGLVVLNELDYGLIETVNASGKYLEEKMNSAKQQFPEKINYIRGKGLMMGLVLSFDASILVQELLNRNVISNACSGNVLRLVPPLITGHKEIEVFYNAVLSSLDEL